jgi:hypothetical protein
MRFPAEFDVKDDTQELDCRYKCTNVIPQRQAVLRMQTPQALEV